ncbi:MAG: ATP-binding protein [Gemmatimonadota bacterium]|nr:ATP-binding protein [Gemmatimonadota bacterium]
MTRLALLDSPCVMVDVSGLQPAHCICAQFFPSALSRTGGWPWSKLAMFGASPMLGEMLRRHRVTTPCRSTSGARTAWALVQDRPNCVRLSRVFVPEAVAPRRARALVTEVGGAWLVPDELTETARLVVTELVTNAVEHTGTQCRVRFEYATTSLGIRARAYFSAGLPQLRKHDTEAVRGRGL